MLKYLRHKPKKHIFDAVKQIFGEDSFEHLVAEAAQAH